MRERLRGLEEPWLIAGGWAIDLAVGRRTRHHRDIEAAMSASGFEALRRALPDHELLVVGGGLARPATEEALRGHHQTWVRDPRSGAWRLDVFREPWEGDTWVFRRDPRIRLPLARAVAHSEEGIPYLHPEIVLLFKAGAPTQKDEADLTVTLPLLRPAQRRWLEEALALVHPGHAWLEVLES